MFYLVIIQNDTTQAIYRYDTFDQALAAFHAELAYRAEGRTKTACAILNRILEVVKREDYEKEVVISEPEEIIEPEEVTEPEEPVED